MNYHSILRGANARDSFDGIFDDIIDHDRLVYLLVLQYLWFICILSKSF